MVQVQQWEKDPDLNADETLLSQADYAYDVFGNRIEKAVDSTVDFTQRYAYDGWKPGGGFIGNENWDIWADLDSSNNWKTRNLRGDALDQLFAWIGHRADPHAVLDADGSAGVGAGKKRGQVTFVKPSLFPPLG